MAKQKSKNRKYKAGQLITINNKIYRVTKVANFTHPCESCACLFIKEACTKYCSVTRRASKYGFVSLAAPLMPYNCHFKRI